MSKKNSASQTPQPFPRRDFLKAGALVIGFSSAGLGIGDALAAQAPAGTAAGVTTRGATAGPPDPKQIDTWLAVHADNTATVYIGYVELGQGASTSLLQVAAEELDLGMDQVNTISVDTNISPNQGGTYSSSAIARGSPGIRTAAAGARLALLEMASKKLETPVERLTVSKGVVSSLDSHSRSVTYGELVGGKLFNLPFTGKAPLKPVAQYKLV
ncbi:MAG TPA: molybdopterin cofactor-binding domain-containing protein, partial [Candidatus Polarisedimenticolia bacterium]|nr:molybdopterin cofactor-binding domain-containing protein [Candidatus Polarisedimenticolia bacterium]